MLEQDKLRNADILIQQETNRTNPIVSSHHHCLIFIKYTLGLPGMLCRQIQDTD